MNAENFNDFADQLTFSFSNLDSATLLRELILYIAHKCSADPTFGAVKLRKIIFFADAASYIEDGKPITGVEYIKLDYGPVPSTISSVLFEMQRDGMISQVRQKIYDYEQIRIEAVQSAKLELFSSKQIALVDDIIAKWWGRTAKDVSNSSHGIAWKSAKDGEPIPYEAFLLSNDSLTDEDIRLAEELIEANGWDL